MNSQILLFALSFMLLFMCLFLYIFMSKHDIEKSNFQPLIYSNLWQINAFFFIPASCFRGVVASVWDCLYLLIYSVLIKPITLQREMYAGYSYRF